MADKRYRQPGYQDQRGEKAAPRDRSGPPSPAPSRMLGARSVSRCAECGTQLPPGTEGLGRCSKCGAELHACKQCTHFDPGQRFECTQPIAERVADKGARNACPSYSLRVMVERDASPGAVRPDDARRAFDSLFRKPGP